MQQRPFSTAGALRGNLAFGGHISTRTVIRRLHHQGMRARRPIKRPHYVIAMLDLTGHMIIWGGLFAHGDGSTGLMKVVFLLRPTDGRARVLRQRNTSFQDNHMLGTTAFGDGGVTVWGCFSFDYNLDLYVLDGNLTGQKHRDNVLAPFRQSCVG